MQGKDSNQTPKSRSFPGWSESCWLSFLSWFNHIIPCSKVFLFLYRLVPSHVTQYSVPGQSVETLWDSPGNAAPPAWGPAAFSWTRYMKTRRCFHTRLIAARDVLVRWAYLLYTNGFFLLVCYNKLGIVHCTYLGVSGYNSKKILFSFFWRTLIFTNSVDADEMPHYAAFHQGLHCL